MSEFTGLQFHEQQMGACRALCSISIKRHKGNPRTAWTAGAEEVRARTPACLLAVGACGGSLLPQWLPEDPGVPSGPQAPACLSHLD